jgi:hypothetical protein
MDEQTEAELQSIEALKNNLGLHIIVETEVADTPFGTITFNVQVVDGIAQLETVNCVENIRYKFEPGKKSPDDV